MLFAFFMWQQQTLNPFLGVVEEEVIPPATGNPTGNTAANTGLTSGVTNGGAQNQAAALASNVSQNGAVSEEGKGLIEVAGSQDQSVPSDEELESAQLVTLANDKLKLQLSLLGGRVKSQELKDYKDSVESKSGGKQLVSHLDSTPYSLGVYSGGVSDQRVAYQVSKQIGFREGAGSTFQASADVASLFLVGKLPDGRDINKTISLKQGEYQVNVEVALSAPPADGSGLALEIARYVDPESLTFKDYDSGLVAFDGTGIDKTTYGDVSGEPSPAEALSWLAISEKYFTDVLIPRTAGAKTTSFQKDNVFFARASGSPVAGSFSFYSGPKDYDLLRGMADQLHRTVDFGWTSFISVPLMSLLGTQVNEGHAGLGP